MIFFAVLGLLLLFALVVFRGAPYVPSHRRAVEDALNLLDLKPGNLVVDLGSGDGAFLKAAAQRGLRAIGYEINPILFAVSLIRCWPWRRQVSIKLRDFWLVKLPPETKAVYIFMAKPYMSHLERYIQKNMDNHKGRLLVASYGFALPGIKPKASKNSVYCYELKGILRPVR